jgi:hypothetical protein
MSGAQLAYVIGGGNGIVNLVTRLRFSSQMGVC